MVEKNKHYYYKSNEYVVVGFTLMKSTLNGEWVQAVQYKRATEVDDLTVEPFTRERTDFEYNFIPAVLEKDMDVIAESMGKIIGVYSVININENNEAECSMQGEAVISLVVSVNVQPNGELTVIQGGAQATTYVVFMQDIKKRLGNSKIISDMVNACTLATARINNISPSSATYSLQEAQASIDQTLQMIYNKFGV